MTALFSRSLVRQFAASILALAVTAVFAPAIWADATTTPATPAPAVSTTHYHGIVTAVDATAGTITIQKHKEAPVTFTLAPNAKVTVSKAPSTLASVLVGYEAGIKSVDGKTALKVSAHPKVPHGKNAAKSLGAPGTPGAI